MNSSQALTVDTGDLQHYEAKCLYVRALIQLLESTSMRRQGQTLDEARGELERLMDRIERLLGELRADWANLTRYVAPEELDKDPANDR